MEITSVNNELVKEIAKLSQRKYRDESKKFLLEGYKCINEALNEGIELDVIFVNKEKQDIVNFPHGNVVFTTEAVLKKISTTDTPPDVVAVGFQKSYAPQLLKTMKKVALFENISDLGNLGTIIRTAAAFGVDGIILYGDCADVYAPKCVRSSVGNLWKVPIIKIADKNVLLQFTNEFYKVATVVKGHDTVELNNFEPKSESLVMFGSEACGLSVDLVEIADEKITVKMQNNVESLNLSVSAGIVLYKLFS